MTSVFHPVTLSIVDMPWHAIVRSVIEQCRLVLLVGEPGNGKTEASMHLLTQFCGVDPVVVNGTPETERQDFLGTYLFMNGESVFSDFSLSRAIREKRPLVINDFGQIPIETLVTLLPLRDGRSTFCNPITSEELSVADDFRVVATANPESLRMTCRRATESAKAILEGFAIVEVPVPTNAQLKAIVESHLPEADPDIVAAGLTYWDTFRGIRQQDSVTGLSVRSVLEFVRLRAGGVDERTAVRISFVNKFIYDEDLHSSANLSWSMNGTE